MNGVAEEFVGKFLTELREDNAAVFVGVVLSKAAGFVDWLGLRGESMSRSRRPGAIPPQR